MIPVRRFAAILAPDVVGYSRLMGVDEVVTLRLQLQAPTDISSGRRNLIASLHTGRAVLGASTAQLHDWTARHRKVGNPNVVVAVHHRSPWAGETAALERRTGVWRAIRPQHRDAATTSLLLGHSLRQVIRCLRNTLELQACIKVYQMGQAEQPAAEPLRDPNIALAVDGEAAIVVSGLEFLGLAWIGGWKARNVVECAIGYPNPVLLIDGKVKRCLERLARLCAIALANDPARGQIPLWKEHELALLDAENPNVSAWRGNDPLHKTEFAIERDTFWWRQRLAVLVKYRDGLAAVVGEPGIIFGVDGCTEGTALHSPAGKACSDW